MIRCIKLYVVAICMDYKMKKFIEMTEYMKTIPHDVLAMNKEVLQQIKLIQSLTPSIQDAVTYFQKIQKTIPFDSIFSDIKSVELILDSQEWKNTAAQFRNALPFLNDIFEVDEPFAAIQAVYDDIPEEIVEEISEIPCNKSLLSRINENVSGLSAIQKKELIAVFLILFLYISFLCPEKTYEFILQADNFLQEMTEITPIRVINNSLAMHGFYKLFRRFIDDSNQ